VACQEVVSQFEIKVGVVKDYEEQGVACQEVVGGENKFNANYVEYPNLNTSRREIDANNGAVHSKDGHGVECIKVGEGEIEANTLNAERTKVHAAHLKGFNETIVNVNGERRAEEIASKVSVGCVDD